MDIIDWNNLTSSETISLLILKELQLMRQDVVASMLRMEEQINNFNYKQSAKEDRKLQKTEDQSKFDNDDQSTLAIKVHDKTICVLNDFHNPLECSKTNGKFPEECDATSLVTFTEESKLKLLCNEGSLPHNLSGYPSTSNNCQFAAESFEVEDDEDLTSYNRLNQEKHNGSKDFKDHHTLEKQKLSKQGHGSTKCFKTLKGCESSDLHISSTLLKMEYDSAAPYCSFKSSGTNQKTVTHSVHKLNHSGQKEHKQSLSLPQATTDKNHLILNNKVCPKCFKTYSCVSNLNRHLRSHSDERYQCPVCYKCFLRKYRLKDHLKTHFKNIKINQ